MNRRLAARWALPAMVAVTLMTFAAPASSATYTDFQARSEGCAGGGDVCGTFPLLPLGDARYAHSAQSDGTIKISSSVEGGIPVDACLPALCPPGRYHAEALGSVSVIVDTPAGASSVTVSTPYRLDELVEEETTTIGSAEVTLGGALSISRLTDALCSDGSAVIGGLHEPIGPESALGPNAAQTTYACTGASGTLPALPLSVGLLLTTSATTDGGAGHAAATARLLAVEVIATV